MSGERVDLVDASGVVQMRGVERDDASAYEGLHMQIVIVVVLNGLGHVLVHQRSHKKTVNPGDVDFICGGVAAGENGETAARRETHEEGGVELSSLHLVSQGVNKYNRYRLLYVGTSDEQPVLTETDDIEWLAWKSVAELEAARNNGSMTFVDEFFDELVAAQAKLAEVQQ